MSVHPLILDRAPVALPVAMMATIRAAYRSPPRAYHNLDHIIDVMGHWHAVAAGPGWRQPVETWLALLYHDAVYEAARRDNEAMSAALARHEIESHLGGQGIDIERVCTLIEWTAGHGRHAAGVLDDDAAHMLDCDMAILGADAALFDAYDAGIAAEYRDVVPAWMFRFNRRRFLKRLLAAPRIYLTAFFHERFDAPARGNLKRAIASGRSALKAGAGR